jgi:hypothetical protein
VGVDRVGLGLAAVDGLHVQGVAQDEGDLLLLAEVGQPVPGEHALTGDGQAVAEGGDGLEEGLGAGRDGLGQGGRALGVEDVQGEGPGVQVDAAVESVLLVVEPHHGLRGRG